MGLVYLGHKETKRGLGKCERLLFKTKRKFKSALLMINSSVRSLYAGGKDSDPFFLSEKIWKSFESIEGKRNAVQSVGNSTISLFQSKQTNPKSFFHTWSLQISYGKYTFNYKKL